MTIEKRTVCPEGTIEDKQSSGAVANNLSSPHLGRIHTAVPVGGGASVPVGVQAQAPVLVEIQVEIVVSGCWFERRSAGADFLVQNDVLPLTPPQKSTNEYPQCIPVPSPANKTYSCWRTGITIGKRRGSRRLATETPGARDRSRVVQRGPLSDPVEIQVHVRRDRTGTDPYPGSGRFPGPERCLRPKASFLQSSAGSNPEKIFRQFLPTPQNRNGSIKKNYIFLMAR